MKHRLLPILRTVFLAILFFSTKVNKVFAVVDTYCGGAGGANPSVNTALGCIPVDPAQLVGYLLPRLFGIVGGISFLLMAGGFISWALAEGDPKKIGAAQETITSALTGLLFTIFSLFIYRLIALNILQIPGLQ